jgi:hypothetical protein
VYVNVTVSLAIHEVSCVVSVRTTSLCDAPALDQYGKASDLSFCLVLKVRAFQLCRRRRHVDIGYGLHSDSFLTCVQALKSNSGGSDGQRGAHGDLFMYHLTVTAADKRWHGMSDLYLLRAGLNGNVHTVEVF